MQYTVKKPINNNILRVVDPTGCELIVTGRGLGFGVKPGYKIEAETVERSYRMTSPAVQQKLVELLEQIPYEHLLLTDELVAMIRSLWCCTSAPGQERAGLILRCKTLVGECPKPL